MQLAGHGVVEAMKRSGAKEVRADILPSVLSPLVAKQIMIADNLHAQQSIPDEVKLAELLTEQQDAGIDLSLLGTDAEYIKQLVDEAYKEEKEDEQKNLLSLLDITIDGPRHVVRAGEVWQLGPHILAVVHVFRDWAIWNQYLQGEETLFLPFPGPFVALSKKAREGRMVLVQPETYIAGHILDRYAEVHGEQSLRKIGDTSHSLSFSEEEEIDAEV